MCGRVAIRNAQSLGKNNLFLSQKETLSKRKRLKLLIALSDFLYKVWIVQQGFSKFVFGKNCNLGTTFSVGWKLLVFQTFPPKPLFHLVENSSFNYSYIIRIYGRKAGFSLTLGTKVVSDKILVLMLHIVQQSKHKIIKWKLIPCIGNRLSI